MDEGSGDKGREFAYLAPQMFLFCERFNIGRLLNIVQQALRRRADNKQSKRQISPRLARTQRK